MKQNIHMAVFKTQFPVITCILKTKTLRICFPIFTTKKQKFKKKPLQQKYKFKITIKIDICTNYIEYLHLLVMPNMRKSIKNNLISHKC